MGWHFGLSPTLSHLRGRDTGPTSSLLTVLRQRRLSCKFLPLLSRSPTKTQRQNIKCGSNPSVKTSACVSRLFADRALKMHPGSWRPTRTQQPLLPRPSAQRSHCRRKTVHRAHHRDHRSGLEILPQRFATAVCRSSSMWPRDCSTRQAACREASLICVRLAQARQTLSIAVLRRARMCLREMGHQGRRRRHPSWGQKSPIGCLARARLTTWESTRHRSRAGTQVTRLRMIC